MLAELCAEERRDDVGIGVRDHRHHDESGGDELHVVETADLAHPPADQAAEYDEVESRGDSRGQDGLAPDAHDAAEFADHDGLKADPLGRPPRNGHGGRDPAHAGFPTATTLFSP